MSSSLGVRLHVGNCRVGVRHDVDEYLPGTANLGIRQVVSERHLGVCLDVGDRRVRVL